MIDHARYKYLLHLDGQTCSSRLEQLLVMNSVVFKEESGYHAFYHHLLKPGEHYVPVWKEGPEDVLEALKWARAHDDEARAMARRAQRFAQNYLHPDALACYWFTLLGRLAQLQRFEPGRGRRAYPVVLMASEYLGSNAGKAYVQKHGLSRMELPRAKRVEQRRA
eukprot:363979-Chlamydomonas_euryale.AAC.5